MPSKLAVEYSATPLGLDEPAPRLAWRSPVGKQTAYRIRVAASPQALEKGDLVWDSGKVASDANVQIAYAGPPLKRARALLVAGTGLGRSRSHERLEHARLVGNGPARAGGLAGEVDFRPRAARSRLGRCHARCGSHAYGQRSRRAVSRAAARQDLWRRLCLDAQRGQGRRRPCRVRADLSGRHQFSGQDGDAQAGALVRYRSRANGIG